MLSEDINIYKSARENADITQEKAAELLDISVESVRAYELDKRFPPENVVLKMVDIYNDKILAYNHMQATLQIASELLPRITITELPQAVLRLLAEVQKLTDEKDRLVEIACDGIIDDTERIDFNNILSQLDNLHLAIIQMKYSKPSR